MKINYKSDIHLEFGRATISNPNKAEVLVLAGDVVVAEDLTRHAAAAFAGMVVDSPRWRSAVEYINFFKSAAEQYSSVVYVMGNHEHYGGYYDQTEETLRSTLAQISPNIHLLQNSSVELGGVLFVGTTLWTDLNNSDPLTMMDVKQTMSDYRVIRVKGSGYRRLSPVDTVRAHHDAMRWLSVAVKNTQKPVVVVSHHAPCERSVAPWFKNDYHGNAAYYTDLSEFILDNPQIQCWVHGHMHNQSDYLVGPCRVVCEPRGYYGDQTTEVDLVLGELVV